MHDPARYVIVYMDLQMVNRQSTPAQFWAHGLRRIARALANADLKSAFEQAAANVPDTFELADLFSRLSDYQLRVGLLLDEFENVTENSNFDAGFFYSLRSLAIHGPLALVTASRKELVELCHSEAVKGSPFFNIFANINLRLLNDEEARDLVTHSLAPTGVTFTSEEHVWLGEVAGGYPYFLQAACHFLFDAHTQSPDSAARQKYALKEFREEAFPHFSDYWLHSDDGEKITLTMLALLSHGGRASERRFHLGRLRDLYERSELVLIELDKRGLVRRDTDAFALFSTAFSEWILNEIKASTDEKQTYETWLASNEGAVGRLSKHLAEEVKTQVLPQIKTAYRDLTIGWLSNPQTIASAVTLLSNALR